MIWFSACRNACVLCRVRVCAVQDTVIPRDQRRELACVPGWKSGVTSVDDERNSDVPPSQDGVDWSPESPDVSSNPNGNYNFVDGISLPVPASPPVNNPWQDEAVLRVCACVVCT